MYKIHQIEDVFSNKKRKKLIKDCQPLLKDLGEGYPGRQTYGDLYLHPDFISPINHILKIILKKTKLDLVIDNKVWINWTNGKNKDFSNKISRTYRKSKSSISKAKGMAK